MTHQRVHHFGLKNIRKGHAVYAGLVVCFVTVYLANVSWLAHEPKGQAKLMEHRGVHQPYDREGIGKDTCTAERMLP